MVSGLQACIHAEEARHRKPTAHTEGVDGKATRICCPPSRTSTEELSRAGLQRPTLGRNKQVSQSRLWAAYHEPQRPPEARALVQAFCFYGHPPLFTLHERAKTR